MKFREYIRAKVIPLCAMSIAALYLLLVLYFMRVSLSMLLLLGIGLGTACLLWLVIDWRYINKRLRLIRKRLEGLSEKYLLGEVLDKPRDLIEREYFFIMKEISRSAIGAVEQVNAQREDYYQYVESWVHEIKTPLTACSLILSNGGEPHKLRGELRRADNLTEMILTYAKLRTVQKDTQITFTDLRKIIDHAIQQEMELLIAAGISVTVVGEQKVYTDAKQIEFILKQLMINCAKYCFGCQIRFIMEGNLLIVEDDGPGIPAHELSRVTERGFTGAKWRSSEKSTGMGLYIVNELCKQMNISMTITSETGKYTRFTFQFSA